MPPPPVAGAAVGNGLGEGLGDGDADTDGVAEGVALAVSLGLADSVGVPVGVAVPDAPGENVPPAEGGEPPVQAETVAEANMVTAPQPIRVILARSPRPATAVRTFMALLKGRPPKAPVAMRH